MYTVYQTTGYTTWKSPEGVEYELEYNAELSECGEWARVEQNDIPDAVYDLHWENMQEVCLEHAWTELKKAQEG
jgi:hypothetical protein